jgi:hypothetical protein
MTVSLLLVGLRIMLYNLSYSPCVTILIAFAALTLVHKTSRICIVNRLLKYLLEQIEGVGTVRVRMYTPLDALPSACSAYEPASTEIYLEDHVGPLSPMFVTNATANTQAFPLGGTTLALSTGSETVLRMATVHTLHCSVCPYCEGEVYFTYGDSISTAVNITGTHAETHIHDAIYSLTDLLNQKWPALRVNVTIAGGATTICNRHRNVTTTITLYSTYGNIPSLGIIDA